MPHQFGILTCNVTIDSLERIQCKAARFTTRDFRQRSSVTAMMCSLQWEPLAERRTKARVILMYLILNDEVAIPISPSILQPGRRGRFIQPAHHYQQYKHSFYPSATGICYLQNSRTLPHWIASRMDYQSNLCRAGTSSSLWYLWGTIEYSTEAEAEAETVAIISQRRLTYASHIDLDSVTFFIRLFRS